MQSVKSELRTLLETHNHIFNSENIEKMTIKLAPDDVFGSDDMSNIDFNPQTDEKKRDFSERLNENLRLLGLSRRLGNITARREILRNHLEALERKKSLQVFLTILV